MHAKSKRESRMKRANVKRGALPVEAVDDVPTETSEQALIDDSGDELRYVSIPSDWRKGNLLNVRNYGPEYVVTLYPEELDHDKPERALHFPNHGLRQAFVSGWYARESHDPRAR